MPIYTVTSQVTFPCPWLFFYITAHSIICIVEQHFAGQGNMLNIVPFCCSLFYYKNQLTLENLQDIPKT